jgi:hypothetical protein
MNKNKEKTSPSIDPEEPSSKYITDSNRAKYRNSLGRPLQIEDSSSVYKSDDIDFIRQISFRSPLLDQATNIKIKDVQETVNICTKAIEINDTVMDEKHKQIIDKKVEDVFESSVDSRGKLKHYY